MDNSKLEKIISTIFDCYDKLKITKDNKGKEKIYWLEFYHEHLTKKSFVEHFRKIYDVDDVVLTALYDAYSDYDLNFSYLDNFVFSSEDEQ